MYKKIIVKVKNNFPLDNAVLTCYPQEKFKIQARNENKHSEKT